MLRDKKKPQYSAAFNSQIPLFQGIKLPSELSHALTNYQEIDYDLIKSLAFCLLSTEWGSFPSALTYIASLNPSTIAKYVSYIVFTVANAYKLFMKFTSE